MSISGARVASARKPPPLAEATYRSHHLCGSLLRSVASLRCLRSAERRRLAASTSCASGWFHCVDAVVVYPVIELVAVKADVATHLDDRDAPLFGQPAHVTFARAQPERNILEGEESNRRAMLPAHRTPQCAAGGRTSTTGLSFVAHR
jgi:hypothetical protein